MFIIAIITIGLIYTQKTIGLSQKGSVLSYLTGKFYDMAPSSRIHQKISGQIYKSIANYIDSHITDFAKFTLHHLPLILTQMIKTGWNPMFPVICDPDKLTDRGCSGAPDLVF